MIDQISNLSNYTFTIYSFFPVFIVVLSIIMAIIVLAHENCSKVSLAFNFLLLFNAPVWFLGDVMFMAANDPAISLFWVRVQHIGTMTIPIALLFFTLTVQNNFKRYKYVFILFILISAAQLYLAIFTNSLIIGIKRYAWGLYPQYGLVSIITLPVYCSTLSFNFFLYWRGIAEAKTDFDKRRMNFFLKSFLLASVALVDFIGTYNIAFYPFGYIPLFIFMCLLAMGIWRYNLVDITPAFASNEIIKTMSDILVITDNKGLIKLMNPAAERFFNLSEKIVANKHVSTIINDPLLGSHDVKSFLENALKLKDHEFIYKAKNNETRILELTSSILKDSLHEPIGIIFTANDKTEYKKAKESIRKAYKTIQAIFEKMPVGIIILGLDKRIKEVNRAALKMIGAESEDELIGKICHSRISPDEEEKCPIADRGQRKVTFETRMVGPNNTRIPLYKTALRTVINGEDVILESFVDITKSKELEKQLEDYKVYLEEQVQDRTSNLQGTNKQLLSEVGIRKQVTENLKEKVDALERLREDTIKRENEMIEIKKTINQLSLELKRPEPYKLSFLK